MIDAQLLSVLCCPSCRGGLQEKSGSLVCEKCKRAYPVRNGIPVLLTEDAQTKETPHE